MAAKPTALAIRHLAFEDLGCFEPVLQQLGFAVAYHDIGLADPTSLDPLGADLLVILGGPIGAYEEDKYPFLKNEIDLIGRRLASARATIGICLGAQLMARALGAHVYPGNNGKEIGLAPIAVTPAGRASCLGSIADGPVLHWHGDSFDLPAGAKLLASTALYENQAYSYGERALAFQFHPEAGGPGFERWLIGHAGELAAGGVDIPRLRADYVAAAAGLRRCGEACLRVWLEEVGLCPAGQGVVAPIGMLEVGGHWK